MLVDMHKNATKGWSPFGRDNINRLGGKKK